MTMLNILEAAESTTTSQAQYSTLEIIMWYSLLGLSIAALIVYLIIRGHRNTKGLASIQNSIQKELKSVVSKREDVINDQKADIHLYSTSKLLNVYLNEFIAIKEQTSLPDADAIIETTQKVIKMIHSKNVDKMSKDEKIKHLDKIIEKLTFIYGKLDVIRTLIK